MKEETKRIPAVVSRGNSHIGSIVKNAKLMKELESQKMLQGNIGISNNTTNTNRQQVGINKTASINKSASANVMQSPTFFFSPESTPESWLLPKTRQELLKWIRIYFALEPELQSIITMHALYPFSKPLFICEDEKVKLFYERMCFNHKFNLYRFLLQMSLSYWKFGEAIPFGNLEKGSLLDFDPSGKEYSYWKNFILLEPDTVEIEQSPFEDNPIFYLIVTSDLKRAIEKLKQEPRGLENIPEDIKTMVEESEKNGGKIELDETSVSILARLTDPSATRGTPILQCLMKTMVHKDWIRLAQISIAMRHHLPIEHWTIGDLNTTPRVIPGESELAQWRDLINQSIMYPPFTLITPPYVKYEALGVSGKILPIQGDLDFIQEQILIGLGVNKNIILGDGPNFSNAQNMAWNKLLMIYQSILDEFTEWIYNRVFEPIAKLNDFAVIENGIKRYIYPKIKWQKNLDIDNQNTYKEEILKLHDKGYVSTETLFELYPELNYKEEQIKLERESNTIFNKEKSKRFPSEFMPASSQENHDTSVIQTPDKSIEPPPIGEMPNVPFSVSSDNKPSEPIPVPEGEADIDEISTKSSSLIKNINPATPEKVIIEIERKKQDIIKREKELMELEFLLKKSREFNEHEKEEQKLTVGNKNNEVKEIKQKEETMKDEKQIKDTEKIMKQEIFTNNNIKMIVPSVKGSGNMVKMSSLTRPIKSEDIKIVLKDNKTKQSENKTEPEQKK
jgi:hypothetical protein